ncbi:hypothetical protein [Alcanivorax sp.]|uniref:hypothetical protein n=1 Tax=Alcanivorax sp. TaxID=1872427 RepID=UPI0025B8B434|nr:hypothetical protein [Alcanivorax sp.]|tara:strand:- start:71 stop:667 length:597 start_codon:yes stop_codon:yes gene_type:complete
MTHAVRFQHPRYTIRRKFFRFFGDAFHLYTDDGELALYSNMKRFRIREDIRLYADESQDQELLRISTRSIFDFAGAYDVHDSQSDEHVGTLRRSGFTSSFLRDHWTFLDSGGQEIGTLQEDSMIKALVRRYIETLAFFFPQHYHATVGDSPVAEYRQRFNPFILKLDVDFSADREGRLDKRLGIAAGVLMSAIEGRQE